MGRRRVAKYFGNHLLGDYLTEAQAKVLLKLRAVTENQGGISELKNMIYDLTPEQIKDVVAHRNGEIIPEEDRALGELSDLQTVGVSFMYVSKRVILGDSVGMGKTVQVAALVNYLTQEYAKQGYSFNVLYLTEKNLIKQSSEELIRFSGEYFHTLQGEKQKIAKFTDEFNLTKVNICGSHSLIKHPDFHKWCNSFEEHYGEGEFPFDMVVIDESGAIITNEKNGYFTSGKVFVDRVPYVICMNGGPFENHLDKFRTQIEFIDSTLLFTKTEFNKRYQIMDWYGGRPQFSGKYQNAEDFKEKIALRYLKRTREGQGAQMIDCTAELIEVQPSKVQKEMLKKSALPQMVLDCPSSLPFSDVEFTVENVPKAGALLDLLKGKLANVGQVLIYTTLKKPHEPLKKLLAENGIHSEVMNGSTPTNERNEIIDAFKRGDFRVLITNVQRGLNFGKCNHCVFYNYDGNPNNMVQFEGRITRDFNIVNKHVYMIVTKGIEKQKLLSEIANRANASSEFAGRDFSMILDLLKEHANQ